MRRSVKHYNNFGNESFTDCFHRMVEAVIFSLERNRGMSLRFVLGPSGSGKSTYVQKLLAEDAKMHRDREYLLIVPDQFTLETQRIMATQSVNGGILNIDVLSFGRLTHRIFTEVGRPERILLDDLGKCLILRRVIQESEENLKVLKKGIHTPGYVEEVKSVLSEFMQYGLRPADLEKEIRSLSINPALRYKLEDFLFLYRAFEKSLAEKYTTREETLYCLAERIPLSGIIRKSTLVFDGFTGFTPIQNEVIAVLMENAMDVIITLPCGLELIDPGKQAVGDPEKTPDFTRLFYLSDKTVRDLTKLAKERDIPVLPPHYLTSSYRFSGAPSVAYLERNLFRKTEADYPFEPEEIHVSKAQDETHECKIMCRHIFDLIEKKNYRYRDMAVVCGDLQGYSEVLKKEFGKYKIPYFLDTTTHLTENPFVNYITSFLDVISGGYAYRDVCLFVKSPFSGLKREDTDLFDNYILAKRIRGFKMYGSEFTKLTVGMYRSFGELKEEEKKAKQAELLGRLNGVRSRFAEIFLPLEELGKRKDVTAKEWLTAFYRVLAAEGCQAKLEIIAEEYEKEGNPEKALEYNQVYGAVMDLFDQIVSLIGDEVISVTELKEILEAGFGEIRIGIVPKSVDVLPVCDLIRSRFSDIKVLFFLGVNDGNIPHTGAGGGLLSDMERSALMEQGLELAPNRAMESFAEQLYLYQILTKPSEELYLSFLSVTEAGQSRKPAYLIGELKKLFPKLKVEDEAEAVKTVFPEDLNANFKAHNILSNRDLREEFASLLGLAVEGKTGEEEKEYLLRLYGVLKADPDNDGWLKKTVSNAFDSYASSENRLEKEIAEKIFSEADRIYKCSVSSLENFAGCAYKHFLTYGLKLTERENGEIAPSDTGTIKHAVLDAFGKYCVRNHEDFAAVTKERVDEIIDTIVEEKLSDLEEGLRQIVTENSYLTGRIRRIMKRSVNTLREQLENGKYKPVLFERKYERNLGDMEDGKDNKEALNNVVIRGSIDRIDIAEEENTVYVKIVDYKSGNKDFNEALFRAGLQLQTAVYLNEAIRQFRAADSGKKKEYKPGAMFYYHMFDPILSTTEENDSEVERLRKEELRPQGIFMDDGKNPDLLENTDKRPAGQKSQKIPVSYTESREINSRTKKSVKTEEEMKAILESADEKVKNLVGEILGGEISVSPISDGNRYDACKFCAFKGACGFDGRAYGYKKRTLDGTKTDAGEDAGSDDDGGEEE